MPRFFDEDDGNDIETFLGGLDREPLLDDDEDFVGDLDPSDLALLGPIRRNPSPAAPPKKLRRKR